MNIYGSAGTDFLYGTDGSMRLTHSVTVRRQRP